MYINDIRSLIPHLSVGIDLPHQGVVDFYIVLHMKINGIRNIQKF